jgi:hypothetical protein
MTKPRNRRSDSAAAAVQAAQNAAQGPREPLPHAPVPDAAMPFWLAIMRNRPRDRWNDLDLTMAANLARTLADIERLQAELNTAGYVLGDKVNPRHRLIETLTKRVSALSRLLHVHVEATVGRAQNAGNAMEQERKARAEHDDLIPTLAPGMH